VGTECGGKRMGLQGLSGREVVGRFDGGLLTSDEGGLLLREVERGTKVIPQFSGCFRDYRDSESIEHSAHDLVPNQAHSPPRRGGGAIGGGWDGENPTQLAPNRNATAPSPYLFQSQSENPRAPNIFAPLLALTDL